MNEKADPKEGKMFSKKNLKKAMSAIEKSRHDKKDKGKYPIGTSVWFVAKDKNGAPLYDGVHKVVDNTKKLYMVAGKGYKVEASHKEITDTKPKK